jgi:DNA-binding LytR/AlgR family response regulator
VAAIRDRQPDLVLLDIRLGRSSAFVRGVAHDEPVRRVSFVEIAHVEWFESAGNYVRVHSRGRSYLMRTTVDRGAQRLATRRWFIRVRRSAIVNVRAIASLERYGKSSFTIHLRSGANVVSSRFYQSASRRLLRGERL